MIQYVIEFTFGNETFDISWCLSRFRAADGSDRSAYFERFGLQDAGQKSGVKCISGPGRFNTAAVYRRDKEGMI